MSQWQKNLNVIQIIAGIDLLEKSFFQLALSIQIGDVDYLVMLKKNTGKINFPKDRMCQPECERYM